VFTGNEKVDPAILKLAPPPRTITDHDLPLVLEDADNGTLRGSEKFELVKDEVDTYAPVDWDISTIVGPPILDPGVVTTLILPSELTVRLFLEVMS
jgi:hypothetical protein